MIQHYFGHRIRAARKSKGWSQADLAKRLGKTVSAISSYETDAKAIPVESLISLSELCDVTLDELVYGETAEVLSVKSLPVEEKQIVLELVHRLSLKSSGIQKPKTDNLALLLKIAEIIDLT